MSPRDRSADAPWLCSHCNHRFALPDGGEPRCPQCFKKTGVTRLDEEAATPSKAGRTPVVLGILVVLVAGGVGGWLYLSKREQPSSALSADGDPFEAARSAARDAGVRSDAAPCFAVSDAVRGWAGELGASTAAALGEALEQAHRQGRFGKEAHGDVPMEGPPRSADEAASLVRGGKKPVLSSFELGCVAYAIALAQGVDVVPAVSLSAANSGTAVRRKSFGVLAMGQFIDVAAGVVDETAQARELTPGELFGFELALRGAWYLQQGEHSAAAQAVSDARKLLAEEPSLLALDGQIKVASGLPDLGIEDIAKAVAAKPDALGYYNLGMAYAIAESPFKAFQALKKATELDPKFAEGWMGLGNLEMQRLSMVPSEQVEAKIQEIEAYFAKAGELQPELEGLHVSRAQLALLQDKKDDARALLAKAIEQNPRAPDPRLLLGQLALDEGKAAEAVEHLEAAALPLATKPTGEQARSLLTLAYATMGDWPRAEAFARKLVEASPGASDVRLMLAGALEKGGKTDEAIKVLEEQMQAFPKDPYASLLLAQLALDAKQWPRALELARVSRAARESFEGMIVEYLAHFGAGQLGEAAAVVEAETKRRANARVLAAQALLEQAEVAPALAVLRRAAEVEPDNMEAAVLLYMALLVQDESAAAAEARAAALARAPEEQRSTWEAKFDEALRQVESMGDAPDAPPGGGSTPDPEVDSGPP